MRVSDCWNNLFVTLRLPDMCKFLLVDCVVKFYRVCVWNTASVTAR